MDSWLGSCFTCYFNIPWQADRRLFQVVFIYCSLEHKICQWKRPSLNWKTKINHKTFVGIWYNLYKKKCTGQFSNFKRPELPQTTKWLQNFIFYKERPQYLTKWKILLRQMCHLRDGFMNVNRNCWKQFKLVALKNWKESLNFARKPLRASTALEKKIFG